MQQHAVVIKLHFISDETVPQTVWSVPRVNDIYVFRGAAWRVLKVAHSDLRPPLVYLGEPRDLTESEKRHLT